MRGIVEKLHKKYEKFLSFEMYYKPCLNIAFFFLSWKKSYVYSKPFKFPRTKTKKLCLYGHID